MKITLTGYPKKHVKYAGKKLAASAGVNVKRVRDDAGNLVTVRTLDVGNKAFGRAFGLVFKSNVSKAIAAKKTVSVGKRRGVSKA